MLRRLFGKRGGGRAAPGKWDLSAPLLRWSRDDAWTLRDALNGCIIFGATGSGKTSGSGAAIARAFLSAGFGGLVLTAKNDERAAWERYARAAGRNSDLVVFGSDAALRFNFLDEEFNRKGAGASLTDNVVHLFSTVLDVAERNSSGGGGREDEGYWRRAVRQLLRNLIDLLALATGRITVPDLYRLVVSAPNSPQQAKSDAWRQASFCYQCLKRADERAKTSRQKADFGLVVDYFLQEYPGLSDKTRSVIVSTFTSMADVLQRGLLRELFCTDTSITPASVEDGRIIVIDLPVKEFAEVGQIAQVIFKYVFQRSIERRDIHKSPRPVFLWADEAQHFVTSYDMQFQTTCRAARVATVLLSQNVSNFYAALGGSDKGKAEADSLFANFNTQVFHASCDPVTNERAASQIGRTLQSFCNVNNTSQHEDWLASALGLGQSGQTSAGFSESYEFEVQPSAFSELRTGGPEYRFEVDAIVFQSGRRFRGTGRTWLPVTFSQKAR